MNKVYYMQMSHTAHAEVNQKARGGQRWSRTLGLSETR